MANITIIMHDPLDKYIQLNSEMWADLAAAFNIPHIYKVGGDQARGFVQFGPEHAIPNKIVCVVTPAEATAYGIQSTNLLDYTHPTECVYIFGPDNDIRGWHESFNGDIDYISIITPSNTDLYAFMAATIIMGHRIGLINGCN